MSDTVERSAARRWVKLVVIFILVVPAAGAALWTWATLSYTYASGERAGFIQKISKKGWLCKTWEGELAMVNLPGTTPQIFEFSVRDDAVAHELETSVGNRVALTYAQHKGIPTTCFGETEYFITSVRHVASDGAGNAPK